MSNPIEAWLPLHRVRLYALMVIVCPSVCLSVGDAAHRTPSVYQVWSSYAFPFRRYGWFSVMALSGLLTLTFDFGTSKWDHGATVSWASFQRDGHLSFLATCNSTVCWLNCYCYCYCY